jgi:hypothetical protein
VQFTCIGQDIPLLGWFFNGISFAQYAPDLGGPSMPLPFFLDYDGDLGPIQITGIQLSSTSDNINVTSTFTTNTSVLEVYDSIQCGSRVVRNDPVTLNVSVLSKLAG